MTEYFDEIIRVSSGGARKRFLVDARTYYTADPWEGDGENTVFTFAVPPVSVFRNDIDETHLGTINGLTFTFDVAPVEGDVIDCGV